MNVDGPRTSDWSDLLWFRDWPAGNVPRVGSIVYSIWNRAGTFIYVGMAGRSVDRSERGQGPFGRLDAHASGRRSGNQFCIYVCDRLVLPRMHNMIPAIALGEVSLDHATREFIRSELGFRFIAVRDPVEARLLEAQLRRGDWPSGLPLLNPLIRKVGRPNSGT